LLLQEDRSRREIGRRLLDALERARSRLAVAMATEMKAAPADCRRHYQETEERMRRCVKDLRARRRRGVPLECAWTEALEALGRLPPAPQSPAACHEGVRQLCTSLGAVLAPLERGSRGPVGVRQDDAPIRQ
jgi:hypothetical protein